MRRLTNGFCALALLATAAAAADIGGKASPKPLDAERAQRYALAFYRVTNHVENQYARPVSRADLVCAGLQGLYEAARVPVPAALAADVRQADSEEKLIALMQGVRARFGDMDALKEPQDLLISLKSQARMLDPFSGPVRAEDLNRADGTDLSPGLGLEVREHVGVGPLVVRTVLPGGPAQRAGLRPGDQITRVNGKAVDGPTAAAMLLGPGAGQPVLPAADRPLRLDLLVSRPGAKESFKALLEAEQFRAETVLGVTRREDNSWDYWLDGKDRIAQVRLASLAAGTAEELREVLSGLHDQKVRGLILDLRWCPGGILDEAIVVAQLFAGDALVATVRGRTASTKEYRGASNENRFDAPVLVLVNEETSGGAELIAAALQDHGRARVAGRRTRGKASIQAIRLLSLMTAMPGPDVQVKLTIATFLRPSGKNLNRFPDSRPADDWGVRPDERLEFRVSPGLSARLKEWWQVQTLRPGTSRELLPLDDPANDPQRQEALQAFKQILNETVTQRR